jgi:hypothetical protein
MCAETHTRAVTKCAPTIAPELRVIIARSDSDASAADVCRRVGDAAGELGVPRPSYEQVRVLLNDARRTRRRPGAADVLLDIALRARPATDFDAWRAGALPFRPGATNEPKRSL